MPKVPDKAWTNLPGLGLEGYPAEGPPWAAAPAEAGTLPVLIAGPHELRADVLHGLGMQP